MSLWASDDGLLTLVGGSVESVAIWAGGSVGVNTGSISLSCVSKWALSVSLDTGVGGGIVSVSGIAGMVINTDTLGVHGLALWALSVDLHAETSVWILGVARWAVGWDLLTDSIGQDVSKWAVSGGVLTLSSGRVVGGWSSALVVWDTDTVVHVLSLWASGSGLLAMSSGGIVSVSISTSVVVLLGADSVDHGVSNSALSGGVDTLLLSVTPDVWRCAVVG